MKEIYCLVWCLLIAYINANAADEQFHEELVVRPLAGDHVNTYFQFTTRWHYGAKNQLYHTQLTPRVIAELLQQFDVKELNIALTQGLWRYETWGYPIVEATGGAEFWAWFSAVNLTTDRVDQQWSQLANVFSGVLCASLNFVDQTNSIQPQYTLRPQFMSGLQQEEEEGGDRATKYIRYATLPREIVCTENLTPWKKLLPCGSASGLASLLNSGYVHQTKYHSLGLKVRTLCDEPENCIVELTQTANLVYDLRLLEQSNGDFSLRRLFGMGLNGYCELASSSKIYVQRNEQGERYQLVPAPPVDVYSVRGGHRLLFGVYDMQKQFDQQQGERLFNIAWLAPKTNERRNQMPPAPPPLYAHRYLLGQGQERGRIATELTNTHYEALPIILQELIPWYVHPYLHTLNIRLKPQLQRNEYSAQLLPFKLLHYSPSKQRELPTHLEMAFRLPAQSSALITLEVDYLLLKWLEYPPDANHGHYIGSALVATQLPLARNYSALPPEGHLFEHSFNASRPAYTLHLHTEALIVSLPTPDFSMPYNVICLACTVVALAFGPIHSVATKLITVERQTVAPKNFFKKILYKLLRKGGGGAGQQKVEEQQEPALQEAEGEEVEEEAEHES